MNKKIASTLPGISLAGSMLLVSRVAFARVDDVAPIPEPGILGLIAAAAVAISLISRNRRK